MADLASAFHLPRRHDRGIVKGGDDIKRRAFFATLFTQLPSSSLVVCKFHPEGTTRCSSLGTGLDSWLFHERWRAIKVKGLLQINQRQKDKLASRDSEQKINNHQSTKNLMNTLCRGGICHSRHSRRKCKIFASGVNFSGNNVIYNINESTKYILSWFHI